MRGGCGSQSAMLEQFGWRMLQRAKLKNGGQLSPLFKCLKFLVDHKIIFYIVNVCIAFLNFTPAVRYSQWENHLPALRVSSGVQLCFVGCFSISIPLLLEFWLDTAIHIKNYTQRSELLSEPRGAHFLMVGSLLFAAAEAFQKPSEQYSYSFLFCLVSCGQTVACVGIFGKLLDFGRDQWNRLNLTFCAALFTVSQIFMSRHIYICTNTTDECAYDKTFVVVLISNVVMIVMFGALSRTYLFDVFRMTGADTGFSTNYYSCVVLSATLMAFFLVKLFITIQFIGSDTVKNSLFENIILFGLLVILSTILPGRTIRRGLVALKKEIEYKKTFVRYISHEIRSPLSTTTLGLDYLIEQVACGNLNKEELLDVLRDAKTSCEIATNTLNDLLMFDKIEANMLEVEPTALAMHEFVTDCVRPFNIQASASNINLHISLDSDLVRSGYCKIDKHKMQQVVRNFLTNALKFTPENGRIKVSLTLLPDFSSNPIGHIGGGMGVMRVAVQDNGPGISAENLPKLFGQYVQINAKKLQGGKGSGLGLWLSKSIVEMHCGYMGVVSEGEGKGCTFYFEIPCFTAQEALDPSCTDDGDDPEDLCLCREKTASIIFLDESTATGSNQSNDPLTVVTSFRNSGSALSDPTVKYRPAENDMECEDLDEPFAGETGSSKKNANGLSTKSAVSVAASLFQKVKVIPTTTVPSPQHSTQYASPVRNSAEIAKSNKSALSSGSAPLNFSFLSDGRTSACVGDSPGTVPLEKGISNNSMSLSKRAGNVSKIRLLLADDAAIARKMVERSLSSVCSVCHHANNGQEALTKTVQSMADGTPYDVVLIDYYMPVMTGAEAVKAMREEGFKGIIMAVTGSTNKEDTTLLTRNGANVVLLKPLNLLNFRKALAVIQSQQRNALRTSNAQQSPQQQQTLPATNNPAPASLGRQLSQARTLFSPLNAVSEQD